MQNIYRNLNPSGAQCVNISNQWWFHCNLSCIGGNAGSWVGLELQGRVWITNSPTNYPEPGDVVIWGVRAEMPDGHTALALAGQPWWFLALEQNDPLGSPCHERAYGYDGVAGWYRQT